MTAALFLTRQEGTLRPYRPWLLSFLYPLEINAGLVGMAGCKTALTENSVSVMKINYPSPSFIVLQSLHHTYFWYCFKSAGHPVVCLFCNPVVYNFPGMLFRWNGTAIGKSQMPFSQYPKLLFEQCPLLHPNSFRAWVVLMYVFTCRVEGLLYLSFHNSVWWDLTGGIVQHAALLCLSYLFC